MADGSTRTRTPITKPILCVNRKRINNMKAPKKQTQRERNLEFYKLIHILHKRIEVLEGKHVEVELDSIIT